MNSPVPGASRFYDGNVETKNTIHIFDDSSPEGLTVDSIGAHGGLATGDDPLALHGKSLMPWECINHDGFKYECDGHHDDGSGKEDPLSFNGIGVVAEPFRVYNVMNEFDTEPIHGVLAGPTTLQVDDPANPDGDLGTIGELVRVEVDESPIHTSYYHGNVETKNTIHIFDDSSPDGPGLTVDSIGTSF